jgi:Tol biopolymer transport system component
MFVLRHFMTACRWMLAGSVASLPAWPIGHSKRSERAPQPRYTEIYSSDSVDLMSPALSPDGKWVAFESRRQRDTKVALFIISASGGRPRALTTGGYVDGWPVWFPASDRIVFRSSRVDGSLMTLKIDARTGAPIGDPQRLTIEPVQLHGGYSVSPDGKEVLYPVVANGRVTLKRIPATGGTASVVASMPGIALPQSYWTADGSIEFSVADTGGRYFDVMRASQGGGAKLVQRIAVANGVAWAGPDYLVRAARTRIAADTLGTLSIVTHAGDTLARFDSRGTTPPINVRMRMGPHAGTFMLAPANSREEVRAMSAAGGESWAVRPGRTGYYANSDYPAGFTVDSRNVVVHAREADGDKVFLVPVHGGAAHSVSLPAGTWAVDPSRAGHYFYTYDGHPRDSLHLIRAVEIATGRTEVVSRAGEVAEIVPDANSDDLYFLETGSPRLELRHFSPGHGSTLIRSYARGPDRVSQRVGLNAMAWAKNASDSARVYVDSGDDQPKEILAIRGAVRRVVWSPSGRSLAINARVLMRGDSVGALYVAFGAGGHVVSAPREVAATAGRLSDVQWSRTGNTLGYLMATAHPADSSVAAGYVSVNEANGTTERARVVDLPQPAAYAQGLYWAPDGQTSFAHTLDRTGYGSQVWRIASDANPKPVSISHEAASFWEMDVSPDGKTLVYQADLPWHSTIWRVDVPGLERPAKR